MMEARRAGFEDLRNFPESYLMSKLLKLRIIKRIVLWNLNRQLSL